MTKLRYTIPDLVWVDDSDQAYCHAETPIGLVVVGEDIFDDDRFDYRMLAQNGTNFVEGDGFISASEAKAAANKHWRELMASCLEKAE